MVAAPPASTTATENRQSAAFLVALDVALINGVNGSACVAFICGVYVFIFSIVLLIDLKRKWPRDGARYFPRMIGVNPGSTILIWQDKSVSREKETENQLSVFSEESLPGDYRRRDSSTNPADRLFVRQAERASSAFAECPLLVSPPPGVGWDDFRRRIHLSPA